MRRELFDIVTEADLERELMTISICCLGQVGGHIRPEFRFLEA